MFPVEIVFRQMAPSETVERKVRHYAARLSRHHPRITRCRVVVESRHRRHRKGKLWHLAIEVAVPGESLLAVTREGHDKHAHEDFYVALRDSFNAIGRQLEDVVRRRRARAAVPTSTEGSVDEPGV